MAHTLTPAELITKLAPDFDREIVIVEKGGDGTELEALTLEIDAAAGKGFLVRYQEAWEKADAEGWELTMVDYMAGRQRRPRRGR